LPVPWSALLATKDRVVASGGRCLCHLPRGRRETAGRPEERLHPEAERGGRRARECAAQGRARVPGRRGGRPRGQARRADHRAACLANDPDGKVASKQAKTLSAESKKCDPAELRRSGTRAAPPSTHRASPSPSRSSPTSSGPTRRGAGAGGGRFGRRALPGGGVGGLDGALRQALRAGRQGEEAAAAGQVRRLARDLERGARDRAVRLPRGRRKGKAEAKEDKLRSVATKHCGGVALDAAFPGRAPERQRRCPLDVRHQRARCRFCRGFNAFDGIAMDCDALDDGTGMRAVRDRGRGGSHYG